MVEAAHDNKPPPAVRVPNTTTNWLDDQPRMALDTHGIPLVLHIPGWQKANGVVRRSA